MLNILINWLNIRYENSHKKTLWVNTTLQHSQTPNVDTVTVGKKINNNMFLNIKIYYDNALHRRGRDWFLHSGQGRKSAAYSLVFTVIPVLGLDTQVIS